MFTVLFEQLCAVLGGWCCGHYRVALIAVGWVPGVRYWSGCQQPSQPFIDMFAVTKTNALCVGRTMQVHIMTHPQVFGKKENKWGKRCQHMWTLLKSDSLCRLFFLNVVFLLPNIFPLTEACASDQRIINPLTRFCKNGYILSESQECLLLNVPLSLKIIHHQIEQRKTELILRVARPPPPLPALWKIPFTHEARL